MTENTFAQLAALGAHLGSRREEILQAWRAAAAADPQQTTGNSLSRAQLNDHIPEVLTAFEHRLQTRMTQKASTAAHEQQKIEDVKHGLHRWQQGYRLRELTNEWGHLHLCLGEEMAAYAATHPEIECSTLAAAHQELIRLVSAAISESTAQYARMEKIEAAGRARDLERALGHLSEIDQRRKSLIRQVVHDLGGNVQAVSSAAFLLGDAGIPEPERVEYSELLLRGVASLRSMLGDMMSLARLEAGEEKREITNFDAAEMLAEFCALTQAFAAERGLYLRREGAPSLVVSGDSGKVRRIVQNLVVNALKYTRQGGVTLSWGEENNLSWWVQIKDTGPGFRDGRLNSLLLSLKEATDSAREADAQAIAANEAPTHVIAGESPSPNAAPATANHRPGEGIGLSIVKRLCELLDASIEFASSPETGTTFRILLPRQYASAG